MLKGIQHLFIMDLSWKSALFSSVTAHLQEWGIADDWPVPAWQNIPHIQSWSLRFEGYKLSSSEKDCYTCVMFSCISHTSSPPVTLIHILLCNKGIAIGCISFKMILISCLPYIIFFHVCVWPSCQQTGYLFKVKLVSVSNMHI